MKIRLGISTKLIFMVTTIVVTAIGTVVYVSTDLFREESLTRVQETNKDLAESLAEQSFNILKQTAEKATLIAQTVTQKTKSDTNDQYQTALNILRSNEEIMSVGVYKELPNNQLQEISFLTKDEVLAEFELELEQFKAKPLAYIIDAVSKNKGESVFIKNYSPLFKKPVLGIFFFTQENTLTKEKWLVRAEIRQDALIKLFSKKQKVASYLLDQEGHLLVHSDAKLALQKYNFSVYPIVQKIKEGKLNNHQMEFATEQGVLYLGAFKKTGFGNTTVVAQVEKDYALSALNRAQYRALLITVIIIGLAFLFNFTFSQSITYPLSRLYRATEKVAAGNFDIKLKPQSSDEVGALTAAFAKMVLGLQERDKLKTTFNKFHSKEIAQKIIQGEMKLGGEKKTATVFFSDIRGFTSLSEKMSPDEVVHMLNEYMTEMVKIIQKHKGVVDKYVGDAIMALWGVPESTSQDAANCVKAALEMREVMIKINQKRKSKGQDELQIGIGIHTGEVLAGNIGSEERLEYTVIGDTVNQASRIESANKEITSDILISDTTYALIKNNNFVLGPALEIKVKGKSDKLTVHQVIGTKDESGNIKTVLNSQTQTFIQNQPEVLKQKELTQHSQVNPISQISQTVQGLQYHPTQIMPATQPLPPSVGPAGPSVAQAPSYHTQSQQMMPITQGGHEMPQEHTEYWYLVRDVNNQQVEGPYSLNQLRVVAAQAGFQIPLAYVFKDGDPQMVPITEMPGFSRRAPIRPMSIPMGVALPPSHIMNSAGPSEWYIYVSDTQTMGPYSLNQLEQMLTQQQITRTTYVWKQGLQHWMYLYQLPGFDRRAA